MLAIKSRSAYELHKKSYKIHSGFWLVRIVTFNFDLRWMALWAISIVSLLFLWTICLLQKSRIFPKVQNSKFKTLHVCDTHQETLSNAIRFVSLFDLDLVEVLWFPLFWLFSFHYFFSLWFFWLCHDIPFKHCLYSLRRFQMAYSRSCGIAPLRPLPLPRNSSNVRDVNAMQPPQRPFDAKKIPVPMPVRKWSKNCR